MLPAYDLATVDKLPVIRRLMGPVNGGLALDIGSGTGYTTSRVLGDATAVCLDSHAPNLEYLRANWDAPGRPVCVSGSGSALPFKSGSFDYILCSVVLEHLEDDDAAVAEMSRVLADTVRIVITVPYSGLGYASFLERFGIKTVHDYPGPEFHVRPGYDEATMGRLLANHGLEIKEQAYFFRFFTRLVADCVSLAHIVYQRVVHRRSAWSWQQATEAEGGLAFKAYRLAFPVLRLISHADRLLSRKRGFGLVVVAVKAKAPESLVAATVR